MKGPSIDAIRKFKEQQERKKREEEERKIKEKLSTLEHRASQGDKKAKSKLKRIEKVKEDAKTAPHTESHNGYPNSSRNGGYSKQSKQQNSQQQPIQKKKPAMKVDYFEDLMQMAKQNSNELKRPEPLPETIPKKADKLPKPKSTSEPQYQLVNRPIALRRPGSMAGPSVVPKPVTDPGLIKNRVMATTSKPDSIARDPQPRPIHKRPQSQVQNKLRGPPPDLKNKIGLSDRYHRPNPGFKMPPPHVMARYRSNYQHDFDDDDDEDDYEEEDDYEDDGFVVDEEDDNVQDELRRTIGSIFRYDKRRCDLREQEVERQYRAIGNVSTFEDLEREERRAARLAQAEDAQAFKEEEERKRLKKLRLKRQ